jgi:hypothetical protein
VLGLCVALGLGPGNELRRRLISRLNCGVVAGGRDLIIARYQEIGAGGHDGDDNGDYLHQNAPFTVVPAAM